MSDLYDPFLCILNFFRYKKCFLRLSLYQSNLKELASLTVQPEPLCVNTMKRIVFIMNSPDTDVENKLLTNSDDVL